MQKRLEIRQEKSMLSGFVKYLASARMDCTVPRFTVTLLIFSLGLQFTTHSAAIKAYFPAFAASAAAVGGTP